MQRQALRDVYLLILGVLFIAYGNLIIFNSGRYTLTGNTLDSLLFSYSVNQTAIVLGALLYFISFALFFLIGKKEPNNNEVIIASLIGVVVVVFSLSAYFWQPYPFTVQHYSGGYTDEYILQYDAANALLHLQNPYTVNFTNQINSSVPAYYRTFTSANTYVHNLDYLPFSFIYYIPSAFFGISGQVQDEFLLVVLILVMIVYAKDDYKLIIPIFFLLDYNLILFVSGTITDLSWILLLSLAVLLRERRYLPYILFGLAFTYKPEAIIAAPFFFIMQYKETRFRQFINGVVTTGVTVLAIVLPFIALDTSAFFTDTKQLFLGSLAGQFLAGGVGISGVLPNLPSAAYDLMLIAAFLICTLLFFVKYERFKQTALGLFPMVILWFNSRSLQDYFIFFPILILILLASKRGGMGNLKILKYWRPKLSKVIKRQIS